MCLMLFIFVHSYLAGVGAAVAAPEAAAAQVALSSGAAHGCCLQGRGEAETQTGREGALQIAWVEWRRFGAILRGNIDVLLRE